MISEFVVQLNGVQAAVEARARQQGDRAAEEIVQREETEETGLVRNKFSSMKLQILKHFFLQIDVVGYDSDNGCGLRVRDP